MSWPRIPITIRVPLIVTVFMIAISIFATERVLTRLIDTQTRHVQSLADVYLDMLALALVDAMIREDVWQVFDVLDRSQRRGGEITAAETVVAGGDGIVIASSDPLGIPSQTRVPERFAASSFGKGQVFMAMDAQRAYVRRDVQSDRQAVGSIHAAFDIKALAKERRQVLWTLILTNAVLTAMLAGAAWLIVARMMRPVQVLTRHLERSHHGHVDAIPASIVGTASNEYRRPFEAFNRLASAVAEREALAARLAEEERLASLGRLASGMAHEINNPLGGLFNAIDTLKSHGGDPNVRSTALGMVERGLKGIRDVVRATLATYRTQRDDRPLTRADIDDLRLLIAPEVTRREVLLSWQNDLTDDVAVPATVIRQIILNLVLNACQAAPPHSQVAFAITHSQQGLTLRVEDEGSGLPGGALALLTGAADRPAPIGSGTGLGLWMTNRLVRELSGELSAATAEAGGTRIAVRIPIPQRLELSRVA